MKRLILPEVGLPPSVNESYADVPFFKGGVRTIRNYKDLLKYVGCRKILTEKAKRYQQEAVSIFNDSGATTELREFVQEHVTVECTFYVYRPKWYTIAGNPNKNAGDGDNRIKILQDAIFKAIGIDDCVVFFNGVRKMPGDRERVIAVFTPSLDILDEF